MELTVHDISDQIDPSSYIHKSNVRVQLRRLRLHRLYGILFISFYCRISNHIIIAVTIIHLLRLAGEVKSCHIYTGVIAVLLGHEDLHLLFQLSFIPAFQITVVTAPDHRQIRRKLGCHNHIIDAHLANLHHPVCRSHNGFLQLAVDLVFHNTKDDH